MPEQTRNSDAVRGSVASQVYLAAYLKAVMPWCTCCPGGCDCGCVTLCVKHQGSQ